MTLPLANVLQPLIDAFEWVLLRIYDVVGSWGLSIILLTVVIRAALLPLTLKQFRSMQKLAKLQPEIKKLQEKYKDDKQRMNQEMMRFYSENKVNPLGSCLPLVAQMPVFISLFYMLRADLREDICNQTARACDVVDPGSAQFLFVPDLTDKAEGGVLIALILMYVGSQLASSLLMNVSTDKMQRNLMLILPLIFVPFIIGFPAGLVVYWITTNTWTIGQQYIIRKRVGSLRPTDDDDKAASLAGGLLGGAAGGPVVPQPDKHGPNKVKKPKDGNGSNGAAEASAALGRPASGGGGNGSNGRSSGPPPPPPRRKKKRSGRRR